MTTATAAVDPGATSFGPYRLERLLGRGRSSRVYLARTPHGARVALKVSQAASGERGEARHAFAAEYELLRAISDPRVVRVHPAHATVARGTPCLVMEHVPGGTLRDLMRARLAPSRAVHFLREAARALAAVHAAGLVHRDVAPANLLVRPDGTLVLADFGIATHAGDQASAAVPGSLLGTIRYTAPEQLEGARAAAQADVYSLGALFHEMLSGQPLFPGATPLEIAAQHLAATPRRLPPRLAAWQPTIDLLVQKRPGHRPADAAAVLHEIEALAATPGPRAD
jgi:serine/threonine protein kinase